MKMGLCYVWFGDNFVSFERKFGFWNFVDQFGNREIAIGFLRIGIGIGKSERLYRAIEEQEA